ncbi:aldehyde dehydrogenase [Providencia stuartii]|uniref:Aldehyde dehydrogenase n=2 Tax=Providencia TaxID=586 RepID=A0AAI9DAC3_PROST|nr:MULTISPECIES: aldehyde dehydrogenase [Providencia]ELR5111959.1 aldehyde dehydrogenase [Providencia stuartii]ELR5298794.1 aldehyde dehydrogenase [Providencia stuartii]MDW7587247.1 aldehyde dehydrogenase [Providencia sp. 2023EL-00965]MDX4944174.1 aldehyde dehydrogenase [Providencia manganoxydans]QQO64307.1 aldehyde dehydrogenase [Providencia manganoxydans]
MKITKEQVFERAKGGQLWAGCLIENYQDSGAKLENRTPIDDSVIGYIADGQAADVDAAVTVARNTFISGDWKNLSPQERKQVMLRWATLIEQHSEELAALDCVDAGKPITECLNTDMPATIETFYWYAEALDKMFGKVAPTGQQELGLIVHEPIGVVGAVLPWNFPAQMFAWKVAPALAAGNSVIVKPAELTSLSAYRMVELAYEAGVPKGALSLVCGLGEKVGEAIGRHADIDIVSFTGSTEVGRLFLKYSAESNLKEIVLECGGKSPQVVFADADLDAAVPHIMAAAFWNMSENCSCGSRLIVHESIRQSLLDKLIAASTSWKVGNPMDDSVSIGPMVEKAHFEKVKSFIDVSIKEGAKIVSGGKIHSELGSGWYIEPTIFDNVTPEMSLFKNEVFGPLLAVSTFSTDEEAIALANDTHYGLAASFYSQNVHRVMKVARQINAGTVSVNGFSEGNITTPFGGFKQSGFGGKDNGLEAFEQYTQTKVIWIINH